MIRVSTLLVFSLSFIVLLLLVHSASVTSQSISTEIQLSKVIQDVQAAELSGANSDETRDLAVQLNTIIVIHDELQKLTPVELGKRAQLDQQINRTLMSVDTQANEIATRASQRTSTNHLFVYSSGAVGALIATVVYHYGQLLRQRYRIKRTFQMKIIPRRRE